MIHALVLVLFRTKELSEHGLCVFFYETIRFKGWSSGTSKSTLVVLLAQFVA